MSSFLTEAVAIASALGDDLRLASCLKFAKFLNVHPALARHMYERSEKIFRSHMMLESAMQCANNRLVSGFIDTMYDTTEFLQLIKEIQHETPTLYRKHDVIYNLGIQLLLKGDIERALGVFGASEMADARPVVASSSAVATLICRRLAGEPLDETQIVGATRMIIEVVPKSNRWHISNLLLNIMLLVKHETSLFKTISSMTHGVISLDKKLDVHDPLGENRHLATLVGLQRKRPRSRITGAFGEFQGKHGFALPFYFIWS